MRVLFRLAKNNIKRYKRESFLVVTSISLTISLITIVSILMSTLFATSVMGYASQYPFNVGILGVKDTQALIEEIGEEKIEFLEVKANSLELVVDVEDYSTGVLLYESIGEFPESGYVGNTLTQGRKPENLSEVVVPSVSDFKIGDVLTAYSMNTELTYEMTVVGESTYGWLYTYDETFMNSSNLKDREVSIIFKDGTKNIKSLLEAEVSSSVYEQNVAYTYNDDYNFLKGMGNSPGNSLYFFVTFGIILITIVSLMTFSLILNAFDTSLSQKNQSLSILRTIGTTRRQIRLMIFFEMSILSLIALVLGLLIGTGFAHIGIDFLTKIVNKIDMISFGSANNTITFFAPWFIYIVITLVSFLLVFISLHFKTREIFKSTAVNNQKSISLKANKDYKLKGNTIYSLAKINSKRSKSYRGIKMALFVSTSIIIIISTMFQTIIKVPYDMIEPYETVINGHFSVDSNKEEEIRDVKEIIESYDNLNDYITIYELESVHLDYDQYDLEGDEDFDLRSTGGTYLYVLDDKDFDKVSKIQGIESKVDSFYVNLLDVYSFLGFDKLGVVQLKIDDGDSLHLLKGSNANAFEPYSVKIDKVLNDYVSPVERGSILYIRESYYKDHMEKVISVKSVKYKLDTILTEEEMIELTGKINKYGNNTNYYMYSNLGNKYIAKVIEDGIRFIASVVFLYIGFVVLINIVNISLTNYRVRRKEIAILRSIGASKKQILKMFFFEILDVVLKPWVFALVFANVMSYLFYLWYVKTVSIINPIYTVDIIPILISIGLIIAILLSVMISIVIESRKSNIIDDIKSY